MVIPASASSVQRSTIKAEMLRTSNASIVLVSSSIRLLLSAGVGVVTCTQDQAPLTEDRNYYKRNTFSGDNDA